MDIYVINPDVNDDISTLMLENIRKYTAPETNITCKSPDGGPVSINNAYTKEIASSYILKEIIASEKKGKYDGYVIGCFADPAIHAAKEITNKPVVGIGEASIHIAKLIGESFSIITVGPESRWVYKDAVHRCGAESKLASLKSPPIQSEKAFYNRKNVTDLVIEESLRAVKEDYAEVIILGCGVMTGIEKIVEREVNVPVINPVAAGMKLLESLISLRLRPSKKYSYKHPGTTPLMNVPREFHL